MIHGFFTAPLIFTVIPFITELTSKICALGVSEPGFHGNALDIEIPVIELRGFKPVGQQPGNNIPCI